MMMMMLPLFQPSITSPLLLPHHHHHHHHDDDGYMTIGPVRR